MDKTRKDKMGVFGLMVRRQQEAKVSIHFCWVGSGALQEFQGKGMILQVILLVENRV